MSRVYVKKKKRASNVKLLVTAGGARDGSSCIAVEAGRLSSRCCESATLA